MENMNVQDYGKICSKETIDILKKSINGLISISPERSNYWFPINRNPKNNLEKFILKTFDLYFSNIDKKSVVGFEWWIHTEYSINQLQSHFDCDEQKRVDESEIISPLACTITYLTNTEFPPTFITNVQATGPKSYSPKLPTEIIYSYPGEGKFLIFDSKYLHGVGKAKDSRLTFMYNIWHYEPKNLPECSFIEDLVTLNVEEKKEKTIDTYEGNFGYIDYEIFNNKIILKIPSKYEYYNTYHVNL
jgi:hypothetical protein